MPVLMHRGQPVSLGSETASMYLAGPDRKWHNSKAASLSSITSDISTIVLGKRPPHTS